MQQPPRLRIANFGEQDFARRLLARGHHLIEGPKAASQAEMIIIDVAESAVAELVDNLVPVVQPGQIVVLVSFIHSLDVLQPMTAAGCQTIVLLPLAENNYAFLANHDVAAMVAELLITELASLCEHVRSEAHQEFVAGFALGQLAGEVHRLSMTLQNNMPTWLDDYPEAALLPAKLLDQDTLEWCAAALPTDQDRALFYTLLHYGLSHHTIAPPHLVAWAKKQGEQGGI